MCQALQQRGKSRLMVRNTELLAVAAAALAKASASLATEGRIAFQPARLHVPPKRGAKPSQLPASWGVAEQQRSAWRLRRWRRWVQQQREDFLWDTVGWEPPAALKGTPLSTAIAEQYGLPSAGAERYEPPEGGSLYVRMLPTSVQLPSWSPRVHAPAEADPWALAAAVERVVDRVGHARVRGWAWDEWGWRPRALLQHASQEQLPPFFYSELVSITHGVEVLILTDCWLCLFLAGSDHIRSCDRQCTARHANGAARAALQAAQRLLCVGQLPAAATAAGARTGGRQAS